MHHTLPNITLTTIKELTNITYAYIYWKDNQSQYLGCNLETAKQFKLTKPEDIIGLDDNKFMSSESVAGLQANDQTVIQNNKPLAIIENNFNAEGVGSEFFSYKMPWVNTQGAIGGIVGISINITFAQVFDLLQKNKGQQIKDTSVCNAYVLAELWKQAKPELSHANISAELKNILDHYFYALIKAISFNVYWMNKDGVFQGCNQEVANMFNFKSVDDILGKTQQDIHKPEIANALHAHDQQVITENKQLVLEEKAYAADTLVRFISHKVPLHNIKNEVVGLLGLSINLNT